ncbi:MAG TPA: hypothetical protein VHB98_21835 [Chloroflexota bacterium]|jgi:hypothetical protein|nr:hypothetical protein [Chloroflexota bacterium]
MRNNVDQWRLDLSRNNARMIVLCTLCSFVLLAPTTFDTTGAGLARFTLAFLALATALSWIGASLNRMAAYHQRVTPQTVRAALRRAWRR